MGYEEDGGNLKGTQGQDDAGGCNDIDKQHTSLTYCV